MLDTLDDSNKRLAIGSDSILIIDLMIDQEVESTFLACPQLHHDYAIGHRSKGLARICHSINIERDFGSCVLEIEIAHEIERLPYAVADDLQASQSQVFHAVRTCEELSVDNLLSLYLLACKDETSHLIEILKRSSAVVVVRSTTPESLFVELNLFFTDTTIDHGSHSRIAQRESFKPMLGRTVVPQALVIVFRLLPFG